MEKPQAIREVCIAFIQMLTAQKIIEEPDLFEALDEIAHMIGYRLCANQLGIRGVHIYFEKLP